MSPSAARRIPARRSEILRSRVDDLDFEAEMITIRGKKRDRSREMTFRTVPMADVLRPVLRAWLDKNHPGGRFTLCGHGGRPFSRQMMTKAIRPAVKESPWHVVQG
jgi:integrase